MSTVLFVCVHSSGRSQTAEALFNKLAKGRVRAVSAGTQPAEGLEPAAVAIMGEVGIDIRHQKPEKLTPEMIEQVDKIITMGCGVEDTCPAPFVETADWALGDPRGKSVEKVRVIREQIRGRVLELLEEIP